ncbi:ubiquitin-like domain-containing protein [Limnochorda pilosa]|uniref:ubiquitin-like domain-containing protein n=1 Tax=Limnochorda pilosa TaxID=1555112 RepID=UPI0026EDB4B8|nr:ubiquitin-like domain-containing protein [Limnochorda pilosa]
MKPVVGPNFNLGSPRGRGPLGILKGAVFLALVVLLAAAAPRWAVKEVTITVDGTSQTVTTLRPSVAGVLAQAAIDLEAQDRVVPAPETRVVDGMTIQIRKAFPIVLKVDGQELALWTAAMTVQEFLDEAGVALGPLDEVTPGLETPLPGPAEVQVVRVEIETFWEEERVPYQELRWAEPTMTVGTTRVIRQGREGLDRVHVQLRYEDGVLVERRELARERVADPDHRIIGVGQRRPTSTQVVQTPQGPKRYRRVLEVLATAYTPGPESTWPFTDGLTATGVVARRGVVAVDPTVIPLGSHLYIPGYGLGIAADVGAAIKGNRIDVLYEDLDDALRWGRKWVKVYILDE